MTDTPAPPAEGEMTPEQRWIRRVKRSFPECRDGYSGSLALYRSEYLDDLRSAEAQGRERGAREEREACAREIEPDEHDVGDWGGALRWACLRIRARATPSQRESAGEPGGSKPAPVAPTSEDQAGLDRSAQPGAARASYHVAPAPVPAEPQAVSEEKCSTCGKRDGEPGSQFCSNGYHYAPATVSEERVREIAEDVINPVLGALDTRIGEIHGRLDMDTPRDRQIDALWDRMCAHVEERHAKPVREDLAALRREVAGLRERVEAQQETQRARGVPPPDPLPEPTCPACGHATDLHSPESRIVGCQWSRREGDGLTICGCRRLRREIETLRAGFPGGGSPMAPNASSPPSPSPVEPAPSVLVPRTDLSAAIASVRFAADVRAIDHDQTQRRYALEERLLEDRLVRALSIEAPR